MEKEGGGVELYVGERGGKTTRDMSKRLAERERTCL